MLFYRNICGNALYFIPALYCSSSCEYLVIILSYLTWFLTLTLHLTPISHYRGVNNFPKFCDLIEGVQETKRALERGGQCRVSRSNILQCRMSTWKTQCPVSTWYNYSIFHTAQSSSHPLLNYVFMKLGVECRGKFWMLSVGHFLPSMSGVGWKFLAMSGVGITLFMGPTIKKKLELLRKFAKIR